MRNYLAEMDRLANDLWSTVLENDDFSGLANTYLLNFRLSSSFPLSYQSYWPFLFDFTDIIAGYENQRCQSLAISIIEL